MKIVAAAVAIALAGCPDVTADPGEGQDLPASDGPIVEFDPAASIIPFPNNLVICTTGVDFTGAPCTIGKLAIPPSACESPAQTQLRSATLNQLDGFGTFEVGMQVTFTEAVDPTTLDGRVVMYDRTNGGYPIPVTLIAGTTLRFTEGACATPDEVTAVTVVPNFPLAQRTTYTIAVLDGITTADGKKFLPSPTWALVRQPDDPVVVDNNGKIVSELTPFTPGVDDAKLHALDQLWKAHAPAMQLLSSQNLLANDVLVAWEITTQTTTDPLDPDVDGSPAAAVSTDGFTSLVSIAGAIDRTTAPYSQCTTETNAVCLLEIVLGAGDLAKGKQLCGLAGCAAIGDVLRGTITTTTYQQPIANPLGAAIPGAWTDPIAPAVQGSVDLTALVFVPAAAGPHATVVFGHGLTSRKEALYAFAPQLASAGMASIAIDLVDHGSRAVQISSSGACAGTPDPTALPQCFAPIFTADLAQTRDNIRQSVLDLQRVTRVVAACTNGCAGFTPSSDIYYVGQSLGGIIGTTAAAATPAISRAVLNVSAVGLLDVLEHTDTLSIRCSLVDALIDADVLVGNKSDTATPLCADNAWQTQPGYAQFQGIARWVIDPADGANFLAKLAQKSVLLQEVTDDAVVPNYATDLEGALARLDGPADADLATSTTPLPSIAVTSLNPWIRYTTSATNSFAHASLLVPADASTPALLGTIRLQVDAIGFLLGVH
ncbi:MAG TPA: hypothetical protein VGC41_12605 [Kofleriaceae bacterium]